MPSALGALILPLCQLWCNNRSLMLYKPALHFCPLVQVCSNEIMPKGVERARDSITCGTKWPQNRPEIPTHSKISRRS